MNPEDVGRYQAGAALAGLLVLVVLFLPAAQSLGYAVVVATPSLLQWGLVAALVVAAGAATGDRRRTERALYAGGVVFVVMGLFVGPALGNIYAHEHVAGEMQAGAESVETLPNSSTDHVRVLPREVADTYARSSMQFPQYRATTSDITYVNGSYTWSYGLVPDNLLVSMLGTQRGTVYVDMEQSAKSVTVRETGFDNGIGQLFTDSHAYRTTLAKPTVDHRPSTRFVFEHGGEAYIAQSYVTHEWRFRLLPVPQVYSVPRFGGVQVMDQNGQMRTIPAAEVDETELLEHQNVYPYGLARYRVRSTNYAKGPLNKWFWKEDVLELAELPAQGNDWPVTVPTAGEDGPELTYFVATEPTGSGSGVYQVWTFDGQTGDPAVKRYDEAQIGPQKAAKFIRQHRDVARLNDVRAVEPVPVVRGETLYWQLKVVPSSANGITYTGFVDAETGNTVLVSKTDRVQAFVAGNGLNVTDSGDDERAGATTVTVTVTDADGTVVDRTNVTVPEGGSVQVNVSDPAENDSGG